jgi:F0F1-type ATP synthase membrane subunit b/b'
MFVPLQALASDLPKTAMEVPAYLTGGGAVLAAIYFVVKYLWDQYIEKIKSERKRLTEALAALERAHEQFVAKQITLEHEHRTFSDSFKKIEESLRERRVIVDQEIKELHASFNGIAVAKAKEIAEFDTKIQELNRRVGKLEDR